MNEDNEYLALTFTVKEWREMAGWLRNGNSEANRLADELEEGLEGWEAR